MLSVSHYLSMSLSLSLTVSVCVLVCVSPSFPPLSWPGIIDVFHHELPFLSHSKPLKPPTVPLLFSSVPLSEVEASTSPCAFCLKPSVSSRSHSPHSSSASMSPCLLAPSPLPETCLCLSILQQASLGPTLPSQVLNLHLFSFSQPNS